MEPVQLRPAIVFLLWQNRLELSPWMFHTTGRSGGTGDVASWIAILIGAVNLSPLGSECIFVRETQTKIH
jgi:hypothetical protein